MSFILDALKKSEDERLGQSGPNLAYAHSGAKREAIPRWVLILSALLLVNLAGLVAVMAWKSDTPAENSKSTAQPVIQEEPIQQNPVGFRASPDYPSPVVQQPVTQAPPPVQSNRDEVRSLAREASKPSSESPSASVTPSATQTPATPPVTPRQAESQTDAEAAQAAMAPTLNELLGQGRLMNLPALKVDLHVYAARKEDRFVFINLAKYQEGQRLKEGPLVEAITNDGVILQYQGERFLIPRS